VRSEALDLVNFQANSADGFRGFCARSAEGVDMTDEQRRDQGSRVAAATHLSYELRQADPDTWRVCLRGATAYEVASRLSGVAPLLDLSGWADEVEALVQADRYHDVDRFLRFATEAYPVPGQAGEIWALHPDSPERGSAEWSGRLRRAKPRGGVGDLGAARQLGRRMARTMRLHPGIRQAEAIVPVPDGSDKRPYSLPYILAEMIADILDIPFVPSLVRKARPTPEAKNLTPMERRVMLAGAFVVCGAHRGRVVVIDDVIETGATLEAIARMLEADGTSVVSVAAAYRGDISR